MCCTVSDEILLLEKNSIELFSNHIIVYTNSKKGNLFGEHISILSLDNFSLTSSDVSFTIQTTDPSFILYTNYENYTNVFIINGSNELIIDVSNNRELFTNSYIEIIVTCTFQQNKVSDYSYFILESLQNQSTNNFIIDTRSFGLKHIPTNITYGPYQCIVNTNGRLDDTYKLKFVNVSNSVTNIDISNLLFTIKQKSL